MSEWRASDVTLEALVSYAGDPHVIMHCAGSGSVGFSISHPVQDFERTVETTRDVLEYVRLHSRRTRVVLPSSASVYGDARDIPISIGAPLIPVSPYGVHKKIAEELCSSYAGHFGISVAVVRLFSIYGAGLRKQLLWDACTKLSRGAATFGGTGEEMRDWLHVEDAARLLLAVGQDEQTSPLFLNGATGVGVPTARIIQLIADEFGAYGSVRFSGVNRPGDPLHLVGDIDASRALDWKPEKVLEIELERYVRWFKAGAV